MNKAIEAAEGVLKGDEAGEVTQTAVQEAFASLNKAVKALEEKPAAETVKKESLKLPSSRPRRLTSRSTPRRHGRLCRARLPPLRRCTTTRTPSRPTSMPHRMLSTSILGHQG